MLDADREAITAIRDLISHHPLNPQLTKDKASWDRLCRGLDDVEDASTADGRLSALNKVREALQMDPVAAEKAETGSAVSAGLGAVQAELEQRLNTLHNSYEPLSTPLDKGTSYDLEKARAAIRAFLPGEYRGNLGWDRIGVEVLISKFESLERGLRQRDYNDSDPIWLEVQDALYILRRSKAVISGAKDIGLQDIDLLVRYALPQLIDSVKEQAADIDRDASWRRAGWNPPGAGEG